jgi:anti-sigma factor RsiW
VLPWALSNRSERGQSMRRRTNCHTVISRLSAYQDNELTAPEKDEVKGHLSGCPSCNEQFIKLQQTWVALGSMRDLSASPEFFRQIQRRLVAAEKGTFRRPEYGYWFQRLLPTSAVASLIAAGIVLGAVAGNSLVARTPTQPSPHEDSLLSSLTIFDPVPPGTLADGLIRLMTRNERGSR